MCCSCFQIPSLRVEELTSYDRRDVQYRDRNWLHFIIIYSIIHNVSSDSLNPHSWASDLVHH